MGIRDHLLRQLRPRTLHKPPILLLPRKKTQDIPPHRFSEIALQLRSQTHRTTSPHQPLIIPIETRMDHHRLLLQLQPLLILLPSLPVTLMRRRSSLPQLHRTRGTHQLRGRLRTTRTPRHQHRHSHSDSEPSRTKNHPYITPHPVVLMVAAHLPDDPKPHDGSRPTAASTGPGSTPPPTPGPSQKTGPSTHPSAPAADPHRQKQEPDSRAGAALGCGSGPAGHSRLPLSSGLSGQSHPGRHPAPDSPAQAARAP